MESGQIESRVIVAGGRDFNNYDLLKQKLDIYLANLNNIVIISGKAEGADRLGEEYAKENNYKLVMYQADWNTHGKAAGPIRNKQMAEYGEYLIAFWDGKSKGTKNMIEVAKELGLKIKIVMYENTGRN